MTILEPAAPASETVIPGFVVAEVETACSNVSSTGQGGIVGFENGVATSKY